MTIFKVIMAYYHHSNVRNLIFGLSKHNYWDLTLSNGLLYTGNSYTSATCLTTFIDFNNSNTFVISGNTDNIQSLTSWSKATNSGITSTTIGLTGLDNGFLDYNAISGDTTNQHLVDILTGTTLIISSAETKFKLKQVSGYTNQYQYDLSAITLSSGTQVMGFQGGFYQGFYQIADSDYSVLPNRTNQGWTYEFWINKTDSLLNSGNTLNDLHSDNKGIFFYLGTRAENKFWKEFNGLNTGCTSGCSQPIGCSDVITPLCTIPKERDISILRGQTELSLIPPIVNEEVITNQFLIYGNATKNKADLLGTFNVTTYTGGGITRNVVKTHTTDLRNPFLVYGNACRSTNTDGYGIENTSTFSGFTSPINELDYKSDLIDAVLVFQIKDDGSIGVKTIRLSADCESEVYSSALTIDSQFSTTGVVTSDQWHHVVIKYDCPYLSDCDLLYAEPRIGKLSFYIDGYLKHMIENFKEIIPKKLGDYPEKQVGVPFNISIGGGSQGLLESMTFDGQDPDDQGLIIENNFAGSFIGMIGEVRLYDCELPLNVIRNKMNISKIKYL